MIDKTNIYTKVTNKIISDLENGILPWQKPWNAKYGAHTSRPLRADGKSYRGINVLILWHAAFEEGYTNSYWMTYKHAQKLGGQVKKGEKGTSVVYTNKLTISETKENGEATTSQIPFLKEYTVFNIEQIDGLPETFYEFSLGKPEVKIPYCWMEDFIRDTQAQIKHGGDMAYYYPLQDYIKMPQALAFDDTEAYYATLNHELTHWTSHSKRLNRTFGGKRFGDNGYAMEELVAEIGAAFLCAHSGISLEVRADHAAYIQSWLTILKTDPRAIFTAASHAQQAADYLLSLKKVPQA